MKQVLISLLLMLSFGFASPQGWLKNKLELDGYSVFHYIGGNLFAKTLSSYTFNSWFDREPPSNTSIVIALGIATVGWEWLQYYEYGGYDEWVSVYGSERRAKINAAVDIGLGMIGGLVALRYGKMIPKKHSHPSFIEKRLTSFEVGYWDNQLQLTWEL